MDRVKKAVKGFNRGYNCSQAILSTYCEGLGLDVDTALRAAAAFGGGIGCTAGTCGAVTGAAVVIGLRHGTTARGRQDEAYSRARELVERFTAMHGSTSCAELLGTDISTEEGMARAVKEKLFKKLCPRFVRDAAGILEGLETE